MFCTNCGKEISSEQKFCPECGHPVFHNDSIPPDTPITINSYNKKQPKSKTLAAILAFLLGPLGIHNFYLDRKKQAFTQLGISIICIISIICFSISTIYNFILCLPEDSQNIITFESIVWDSSWLTPFGFGIFFFVILWGINIWSFVEFVLILCGKIKDGDKMPLI